MFIFVFIHHWVMRQFSGNPEKDFNSPKFDKFTFYHLTSASVKMETAKKKIKETNSMENG